MIAHRLLYGAFLLASVISNMPALACGGGEEPISCDDAGPNGFASWMLGRVNRTLAADKAKALAVFTKGTDGFRTADTYVFCVGPDGVMSAHPNPILQGQNVRDLHDRTGNYFIKTMMETAKSGQISVIRYLFPKPGSTTEEPKTTYYTRASDQVCAVGIYDADTTAPTPVGSEARLADLRRKLDGQIPNSARSDWTAFLEALNAQASTRDTAMVEARRNLSAAVAALDQGKPAAIPNE